MMCSYKIPAILTCLVLLHACGSMPMPGKSTLAATQPQNDKLANVQDKAIPLQNLKMPAAARPIGSSSAVVVAGEHQPPFSGNLQYDLQDNSLAQVSPQKVMPRTGKMLDEVLVKNGVVSSPIRASTEQRDVEQGIEERRTTRVLAATISNGLDAEGNVLIDKANGVDSVIKKPTDNGKVNTQTAMLNKSQVNSPRGIPPNVDDIKYNLAQRYFNSGKYQNSIDILESMGKDGLKKDKMRDLLVLSYTKYAHKLESKAELLEAQTVLEKALGMEPNNKQIKEQLAGVKNIRESNRLYEAALESYNAGKREVAFKSFRHILSLNPNHATAKKYYERMKLSVVDGFHKKALQFYRHQQLSEAIEEWDQLLEVDPANDLAKLYRSRAVELKRKFERL